jgi:hypothetical protein
MYRRFPNRLRLKFSDSLEPLRRAGFETCDTADLEVCATTPESDDETD